MNTLNSYFTSLIGHLLSNKGLLLMNVYSAGVVSFMNAYPQVVPSIDKLHSAIMMPIGPF